MVNLGKIRSWAALAGGAACIAVAVIISSYPAAAQVLPSVLFAEGLFSGAGLVLVCTFLGGVRRA